MKQSWILNIFVECSNDVIWTRCRSRICKRGFYEKKRGWDPDLYLPIFGKSLHKINKIFQQKGLTLWTLHTLWSLYSEARIGIVACDKNWKMWNSPIELIHKKKSNLKKKLILIYNNLRFFLNDVVAIKRADI